MGADALGPLVPAAPPGDLLAITGSSSSAPSPESGRPLPTGFLPPDDLSQTQVTITLPPGSTFGRRWRRPSRRANWCRRTRTSSWSTPPSAPATTGSDPFAGAALAR
jgi:hypothetical protein